MGKPVEFFYVIMPVGSDPRFSEKQAILRRLDGHSHVAHFPEYSLSKPTFDLSKALKEIDAAEFIIADLSLERPSCYYELGLAHALQKRTYLIAEAGTPVHQAHGREDILFYEGVAGLEKKIHVIIQAENSDRNPSGKF